MLNKKVAALMNEQINKEFFSAYLYLEISHYYDAKGLAGFANWFKIQAQEERDHAMMFIQYLQDTSEDIHLTAIESPARDFSDLAAPLKAALEHEQYVSASIDAIYAEAVAAKEFRSTQFLDWFVKEQVEEERNAEDLILKYDLFGQDGRGLHALDQELGARVYTAPVVDA